MTGQLTYAYAVLHANAAPRPRALAAVRGVAQAPVTMVTSGSLAAAVSAVPEEAFSQAALQVRLEDLGWLEATARAHHLVVDTLAARTSVLPLRLATVYLDDDRVREMLHAHEAAFNASLDRLADHVEWGVKIYAEAPPTPRPPDASADASADASVDDAAPGRAYLRHRRHQRQTREDAGRVAREAVRRTEQQARELAVEHARHRPEQGPLTRATEAEGAAAQETSRKTSRTPPGENVANDAYLVPRRLSDEFRDRVAHAADDLPGIRVEITGPWAPYSFAVLPARPEARHR
ncbi:MULTISPECIES: GvpL/GvpF family gas vesicle protein [unclassified Streptomyces]|uniref:GvpL/GvpF family gas vesicle protein n=1 Tax=unclassified Streptomyces TaxID=2593676 RepID=UPI003D724710